MKGVEAKTNLAVNSRFCSENCYHVVFPGRQHISDEAALLFKCALKKGETYVKTIWKLNSK